MEPIENPSEDIDLASQSRGYNSDAFRQNEFELDPAETRAYQTNTSGAMASQDDGLPGSGNRPAQSSDRLLRDPVDGSPQRAAQRRER